MKTCRKCLEELPATAFHPHSGSADGLQSYCRRCAAKASHAPKVKRFQQQRREVSDIVAIRGRSESVVAQLVADIFAVWRIPGVSTTKTEAIWGDFMYRGWVVPGGRVKLSRLRTGCDPGNTAAMLGRVDRYLDSHPGHRPIGRIWGERDHRGYMRWHGEYINADGQRRTAALT